MDNYITEPLATTRNLVKSFHNNYKGTPDTIVDDNMKAACYFKHDLDIKLTTLSIPNIGKVEYL